MADVFPPPGVELEAPDWGFSESPDADVIVSKFGDGYAARELKGLNAISDMWAPSYSNCEVAHAEAAYAFLKPRLKWNPVLWTHPISGTVYKVICTALKITYDTWGNAVLDVQFERDFNPG